VSDEKTQYIVVDTETGGLDANVHSLLEIGLVAVNAAFEPTKCESIQVLENPLIVTPGALDANQIDLKTWSGIPLDQAALAFEDFISNYVAPVLARIGMGAAPTKIHLVGWGVGFDTNFLGRLGPNPRAVSYQSVCVRSIFNHPRIMTGEPIVSLQEAASMMNISTGEEMDRAGWQARGEGAHEAVPDALLTAAIMRKLSYTYA